jgi:hypothetical protein
MSKTIEYKDHKFHLGYNDGSIETLMKFLNDEQILHNGQISSISTSKVSDEEYILHSITFAQVNTIKKIVGLSSTLRKGFTLIHITQQWYAYIES